jgi:hypothetical protein
LSSPRVQRYAPFPVELVEELVAVLFFFLCFLVEVLLIVFVLELVVLDVFCASIANGDRSDNPRAAVKNLFIVNSPLCQVQKQSSLLRNIRLLTDSHKNNEGPKCLFGTLIEIVRPVPRNLKKSYLVAVVSLLVFVCLDFFDLCFDELSVVDAVFCAKTTVPESSESPRAAIMIFFIFDISLLTTDC